MAGGQLRDLEHFVDILETLDAIVWEADASTFEFTYVSDGAQRILGYPVDQWIGNPGFWESLIHPYDRASTVRFCLAASRDGRDHQFDYRAVTADGRIVWLHDVVRVVPDDGGTARLLRGVMTDITDRVEAKAQLARSEERYRLLSELTSDYAWSVRRNAEGVFVFEWATDAIEKVHARRPDEVIGMPWISVVHRDDHAAFEDMVRQISLGEPTRRELRVVRPDGTVRWVSAVARRADTPEGVERIVGSSRDITARKRAEQELDASERRFRAVFDNAPLGISTVDLDGHPVLFNQPLVDMLGYPPEQLRRMTFLDFTYPDDAQEDWRLYQELQRGERDSYTLEKRYVTADGSIRWVQLTASLIRGDDGRPICGIGIVHDISDRKEGERERERLQQQLLQSQKMEAIGRLAGGVAHDFNNILAAIVNYAAFIRDDAHDAKAVASDAEQIIAAAENAATLTRQLLVFSRREVANPTPLDLGAVVKEHSKMLRRMLGENIDLVVEAAPVLPPVFADRIQIEQVLLNLAVNARDAMPAGGPLTISLRQIDDGRIRLTVTDAGIGMPDSVRARAFEPFFTTKEAARGTGLGLATVYGIVESVGGEIHLHSAEGRGTTVEILLPVADHGPEGAVDAGAASPHGTETLTILLVEDSAQVRDIARRLLERDGHDVTTAADAHEALRVTHTAPAPFDVVITDVVMPGMSGFELGRELRQRFPGVAVVYMSGYPQGVVDAQGPLDGPLVEKPFTIEEMRRGIVEGLSRL